MQNEPLNQNLDDQQVAGFVGKTFQILNIPDFNKIIYWSSSGTEFTIKDIAKLEQIVLPKYFRHNKMNSFVRQLNMYGFHKTKHNNFKSTFKHPNFQKGKQQLLPLVKRKLKNNEGQNGKSEQLQVSKPLTNIYTHPTPNKQILASNPKPPSQALPLTQKQPDITSVSLEKYFNFSNEFIATTKMINFSLKKVSFNDLEDLQEQALNEDCASIEDQIDQAQRENDNQLFLDFQNVSCFFSSRFNI